MKGLMIAALLMTLTVFVFSCGEDKATNPDGGECTAVTDVDGNVYQVVQIGNQCWMAENLRVTRYRNGDPIPEVTVDSLWSGLSTGALCKYGNNAVHAPTYGNLYNWYAVNDSRHVAPEGWHVPTDEEWKQLEVHLGMSQPDADDSGTRGTDEGGKLKSTGTIDNGDGLWHSPNTGATNESGFSALPGGYRTQDGAFAGMGENGIFWSSTEYDSIDAWYRSTFYSNSKIVRAIYFDKPSGLSVRCVKDEGE